MWVASCELRLLRRFSPRNDRKIFPLTPALSLRGERSEEGNIYPSTYIDTKKSSFYRVVDKKIFKNISPSTYIEKKKGQKSNLLKENNLKKLAFYLLHCKKEVILQHLEKKIWNYFEIRDCFVASLLAMTILIYSSNNSSRKKFHSNVVAVLFVTVLTCCC